MPSRSDVEALRRALNGLSVRAKADLARLWPQLPTGDIVALRTALEVVWPELIASYGELSAAVAADVFESWAEEIGLRPKVEIVRPVDPPRANARMRWAIGLADPMGSLRVILDELVKQPARSTIQRSAGASGGLWARVPTGAETCAFCRMLASRGAVYESKASASTSKGRKFHGDCDCTPVLVASPDDYPAGYNPDALYESYQAARSAADSGSPSKILAQMRSQDDIH